MSLDAPTGDKRIIVESGLDGRIAALVEPTIEDLGYRLVRVKVSGLNGMTVQIMAERADGTMTVEDCEILSRGLSPVLEANDPVDRAYHLEVSSPGIDRPMVRAGDFRLWAGHVMKLETNRLVNERKRFRGKVVEVTEGDFVLDRDQVAYGEERSVRIPFDAVGEARLVLTDELIQASLKADKAARKARGEDDADEDGEGETGDAPSARN